MRQAHRTARADRDIYQAEEATPDIYVICHGWAARVRDLPGSRRQILSFLLPGDLVSATAPFNDSMEFSVEAVTEIRYSLFNRANFVAELSERSDLFKIWGELHVAEMRETSQLVVDLGRRQPGARVARLILQLMQRLDTRGMVDDQTFDFPLGEQHIADAAGLALAEVSKILDQFRVDGLIKLAEGNLKIFDPAGLALRADTLTAA